MISKAHVLILYCNKYTMLLDETFEKKGWKQTIFFTKV